MAIPRGFIRFSFKYVDLSHRKFRPHGRKAKYWLTLWCRLKAVSGVLWNDFLAGTGPSLRGHPIHWPETTEPDGFSGLNKQLRGESAFQFSVSANKYGRVHGFLNDDTFYVVWLDPDHHLYRPGKGPKL